MRQTRVRYPRAGVLALALILLSCDTL